MSIWGDSDAAAVSSDPFKIEPNWYPAIAAEVYVEKLEREDDRQTYGKAQIVIKWKINDPGGKHHNLPVKDRNQFWTLPNEEMDGEQLQRNSFLKLKLRNAFDLTEEEVNQFNPKMGLNKKGFIKVDNNPDKNNPDIVYNNISQAISPRLYEERYGEKPEVAEETDVYDNSLI